MVYWNSRGKLSGRQMGAQRNTVKLCLSPGKAAQNPLPSDWLGKNLKNCKSETGRAGWVREKALGSTYSSVWICTDKAWFISRILWIISWKRFLIASIKKTWQKLTVGVNHHQLQSSNPENSCRMRLLFVVTFEFRKKVHSDVCGLAPPLCSTAIMQYTS